MIQITDIDSGVACQDGATGTGYLMYSEQDIYARGFSVHANNAKHFVCVVYENGEWKQDTNSGYQAFTPVASDLLVAGLDYAADTATVLAGMSSTVHGMCAGYASGDLGVTVDQWSGSSNDGEFTPTGTSFTTNPTCGGA